MTGREFRDLRVPTGIRSSELADDLGFASCSYISHIERDRRPLPDPLVRRLISAVLNRVEQRYAAAAALRELVNGGEGR